jgi:hypothetical protein
MALYGKQGQVLHDRPGALGAFSAHEFHPACGDPTDSGDSAFRVPASGRTELRFDHVGGSLVAQGGPPLNGFSVAGAEGNFVWTEALIEGDTVLVTNPQIKEPVAVRYGWAENLVCKIYNRASRGCFGVRRESRARGSHAALACVEETSQREARCGRK